jgi:Flp pilus assembly pilin Flp
MENNKEKGASLVEYALLLALVCVIVLTAVRALGTGVSREFKGVDKALEEAAGTSITN